ncbi:porin family protein [Coprobacter sp.]
MKKLNKIGLVALMLLSVLVIPEAGAKMYEFSVKAGINIGGTSPMGLPAEIRSINSYNPTLSFSLEGSVKRELTQKWGIMTGIRLETRAMETDAQVKNYQIRLLNDGKYIEGIFTGDVVTKVKNDYVTVPILAVYDISKRWDLKFGGFLSFLTRGDFSGTARNGYIREGNPLSQKLNVDATYDFSDDIRKFNAGLELGAEFVAYKHLSVYGDLTWSLTPIFPGDFTAISFKMYNVYMNLGFAYVF